MLDDGFEVFPATGNSSSNLNPFSGYIYIFNKGRANAIEYGKTIVDNHILKGNPVEVELYGFNAEVSGNNVLLTWSTLTEMNNYGFEIERKSISQNEENFSPVGFLAGVGTSIIPVVYSFEDRGLGEGTYKYRLKQIAIDEESTDSESIELNIEEVLGISSRNNEYKYKLMQNYPNPFNPETTIEYILPAGGQGYLLVQLKVYDILGQEVTTLVNAEQQPGTHKVTFNASDLTAGVYFYRLSSGGFLETKMMILLN
jgi:hypothetical protein